MVCPQYLWSVYLIPALCTQFNDCVRALKPPKEQSALSLLMAVYPFISSPGLCSQCLRVLETLPNCKCSITEINQLIYQLSQQLEVKIIIFKHNFTKALLFVLLPIFVPPAPKTRTTKNSLCSYSSSNTEELLGPNTRLNCIRLLREAQDHS